MSKLTATSISQRYRWKLKQLINQSEVYEPSELAVKARDDFATFSDYVVDKPPASHHLPWIEALVTNQDNHLLNRVAGPNTNILSFRGSAKSTVIAIFVAWVIGHNPSIPIIYVSYSESVALSRSRIIKRIIESPKYKEVFPHIMPGNRWSDTDWEIDKSVAGVVDLDFDYTFYATGIGASITSRRSGLIIFDDIIKSSDSITNAEMREKMVQQINEVLRPTLIPGGRELCVGTRFRPDDVHATEFIAEKGWNVLTQSAIVDKDGEETSAWPERFSIEFLKGVRDQNPAIFSFQYQNQIVRISEISIDPKWIKRKTIPDVFDMYVCGADLSSSQKERADYTVFVLVGKRSGDPNIYVLDIARGRWSGNITKLNVMLDMFARWGLVGCEEIEPDDIDPFDDRLHENISEKIYYSGDRTVYLMAEATSYQSSLQGDFKTYVVQEMEVNNIVYRKPETKSDKLSRLRGVSGLFENGLVIFNEHARFGRAIKELTNFGSVDHDDCVDAIVYALKGVTSRRPLDGGDGLL
jgi:hypothetical protein